jgi:D-alanyl-D-alanine carboxypeptidase
MQQPILRGIVAEQRHDYEGPPLWAFRNINRFLSLYPGADGIKTGYETRAGRLLAASATRDEDQVITVVFHSPDYVNESVELMDYGFSRVGDRARPAPSSAGARPSGRMDEMLRWVAGGQPVSPGERSRRRSLLRSELPAFRHDPALRAPSDSVYERLKAASSIPPGRL